MSAPTVSDEIESLVAEHSADAAAAEPDRVAREPGPLPLPRRPRSPFAKLIGAVVPLAILGGGAFGFMTLSSLREPPAAKEITAPVAAVRTVPVGVAKSTFDIVTSGTVVPFREVTIAAEVDGRVVERGENLRAGRFVKAGEVLARIDPTDYRLEVRQWEQEEAQAGRRVAELDVDLENAKRSLEVAQETLALRDREVGRIRGLRNRGAGTVTDLDNALLSRATAKTSAIELENRIRQLEASRARLEQAAELATARLDKARANLNRTEITAPADGVIVETPVEENAFVRRGEMIAVFDDTSAVEVRCPLEGSEVAWLRANPPRGWRPDGEDANAYGLPPVPATVTYEVLGNTYAWSAALDRVEGLGADRATRTVPVRLLVKDPRAASLRGGSSSLPISAPGALARGMFVTVRLHATAEDELIAIPEEAVRPGGFVWLDRGGKLAIEKLPATKTVDGEVLVPAAVSPVGPDDRLVISPLPFALDGMPLRNLDDEKTSLDT